MIKKIVIKHSCLSNKLNCCLLMDEIKNIIKRDSYYRDEIEVTKWRGGK